MKKRSNKTKSAEEAKALAEEFVPSYLHLGYALPGGVAPRGDNVTAGDLNGAVATAPGSKGMVPPPGGNRRINDTIENPMPFLPGEAEPVLQEGEGHLLTIAPTGTGKGVCALIPNLLCCQDNIVVVDPKGELCAVTADWRRRMGQRVVILDPLGSVGKGQSDSFNPLDPIWKRKDILVEDEAQKFADLIAGERGICKEPYWDNWGSALLKGQILYLGCLEEKERNIGKLYELMHGDDVVYGRAVALDTMGKKMNKVAYMETASFLQLADVTRSGVLSTTQQYLKKFSSPQMQQALNTTTFPLEDFVAGKPMTIYIVLPPEYLASHGSVLRVWFTALIKMLYTRRHAPQRSTVFMIDEAASIGHIDELESAMTLSRAYGVKLWTFWQNLSQLRRAYPSSWETLIDNAAVLQLFGIGNERIRREYAALAGLEPRDLARFQGTEQLLVVRGEARRCWLPNYLRDPAYAGKAAPNPFYQGARERGI